jgi:hypothetical protein
MAEFSRRKLIVFLIAFNSLRILNGYPIGNFNSGFNNLDTNSNENLEINAENMLHRVEKRNSIASLEMNLSETSSTEASNSSENDMVNESIFEETNKSENSSIQHQKPKETNQETIISDNFNKISSGDVAVVNVNLN